MAVSLVLVAVVDVVIRRGLPRRGAVSLMPGELAGRVVAPYVTSWSEESVWDVPVVLGEQGIAYADEHVMDRDQDGVLWARCPVRRGWGRPVFGEVHPLRQRRAMRRLLCQVCAGPADRTKDGVLWLLVDWRHDWPDWPNRMGVIEPPICVPCARLSVRVCPTLRRRGAVAVRARRADRGFDHAHPVRECSGRCTSRKVMRLCLPGRVRRVSRIRRSGGSARRA